MKTNEIVEGDSLQILKQLDSNSIDCIVTDPPYGYSFMNKDWDKAVVSVDTWKECLRVLKSGAFAFIMSSPRQDVLCKMILNLIDAGFETNFTSMYHSYASGFPKAANTSKILQKRNIDKPELNDSYLGFQPKPALEVILVVMKPLSQKSFVDQALSNGKGITWLDDCRIPFQNEKDIEQLKKDTARLEGISMLPPEKGWNQNNMVRKKFNIDKGRFPANLLVSDDALNDGRLIKTSKSFRTDRPDIKGGNFKTYNGSFEIDTPRLSTYGDSGSYSRYFDLDAWYSSQAQFIITPKASPSEKNKGITNFFETKKVNDGRKTEIDNPFQRGETLRHNTHPTIKPIKLMSYLITLGSRSNDIILDPFIGSGTTAIAALQLGRRFIGIEKQKEYVEIARKRLEPYKAQTNLLNFSNH